MVRSVTTLLRVLSLVILFIERWRETRAEARGRFEVKQQQEAVHAEQARAAQEIRDRNASVPLADLERRMRDYERPTPD